MQIIYFYAAFQCDLTPRSNILKILPPKNEIFQIKNADIFAYY